MIRYDVNEDGDVVGEDDGGDGGGPPAKAAAAAGDGGDDLRATIQALLLRIEQLESGEKEIRENLFPADAVAATGGNAVVVKVTGNATGNGKYTGRVCTGTSTAVATGTLAMPEGLTVPAADDALILNNYENGGTTHVLPVGSYHVGIVVSDSGGTKTVVVNGLKVNLCNT